MCVCVCVCVCVRYTHICVCEIPANAQYIYKPPLRNRDKVQVFCIPPCVLHLPVCTVCYIHAHTGTAHCSRLYVCVRVIHLVWSSFLTERLMNGEQRSLQRPGHMATPPRLYQLQHCSFHASIYLSSSGQGSH